MKTLLRRRGLFVALLICALVLLMSIASLIAGGASPISGFLGFAMRPFQSLASTVSKNIEDMYGSMYEYDTTLAENEQLRIRLAELEKDAREYEEVKQENERLKQLIGLKQRRPSLIFEDARIISRDTSNWSRTLTLDRGQNAGIEKGDCVISAEHYLVGVVSKVGLNWCTVVTVIDTDMEIGAKVYRTGLTSVAEGDFALMQQGLLKLSLLPLESDLQNDDIIMTSGVGGLYPKDLAIGVVQYMEADASGLSANAVIKPLVELSSLTQVFIITQYDEGE